MKLNLAATSCLIVLSFVLMACSHDKPSPTASPSTAATTTSTPTAPAPGSATPQSELICPIVRDACALAVYLRNALGARDFEAVATALNYRSYECPGGRPLGAGGPFPLCDGAAAGTRLSGTGIARRYSEGAVVSRQDYKQMLEEFVDAVDRGASDVFGPGDLQVYSVSCLDPGASPDSCVRFAVIFSAVLHQVSIPPLWGIVGGREILAFFAEAPAQGQVGNAAITETWTGIIQPDEGPVLLSRGGTLFDLGRIYPYRLP